MSKKNSFGKFLAFATTVAAIGGVCYVFRDKIKESSVYKKANDKLSNLKDRVQDKFASDDDFFFDDDFEDDFDDDVFDEDAKKNREYTSITINQKDDTETISENTDEPAIEEDANETAADTEEVDETDEADDDTAVADSNEDLKEIFSDVSIPTISFSSDDTAKVANEPKEEELLGYENEGLSDVSEDPDILSDMDRLEF